MRVLHVGFGFQPWVVNGLVISAEATMDGQSGRGHEVGYFFAGRQLPVVRRSFLHRWRRDRILMYELLNSDLIVGSHRGTPTPQRDLHHAPSEAAFRRVLSEFPPDVVHVHDLGGLPTSLLDIAGEAGMPVVMTIHDYHPLCPTVKLYDAYDRICLRSDPGAMCAVCCADAPEENQIDARTLWHARQRLRAAISPLDSALRRPVGRKLSRAGATMIDRAVGVRPTVPSPAAPGPKARVRPPRASPGAYQRRRDVNLERLNRLDALVASSRRSAEIYRQLGVAEVPVEIVPIHPPHIDQLGPRHPRPPRDPLCFIVLNSCSSTQKGADLIAGALGDLSRRGLDERYRLLVYGSIAPHVHDALADHPSVELRLSYGLDELDALLEEADVGLFPSVWEEVYGFVALEFLAKGIPVIGNAVGAIPEHVRPGETGWLNQSCSATELADLMSAAIEHPDEVERLSRRVTERRDELIKPFAAGLERLDGVYARLMAP